MNRSLPPRRGDAKVLGSAWATMPSVRRLGALLECLHEPSFVSPFQGLDRWWAGPPRGVAPGWRVSRRWRSRVMQGLAGLGPSHGRVGGWRWASLLWSPPTTLERCFRMPPHLCVSAGGSPKRKWKTSFETLAWHLPPCESAGGGSRLPPRRTEARHPCRRMRARGLHHEQRVQIHRRIWGIPNQAPF